MADKFETIINKLFFGDKESSPVLSFDIVQQFKPGKDDRLSIAKSLNACFFILLCGKQNLLYKGAQQYLKIMENKPEWAGIVRFYRKGLQLIETEIGQELLTDVLEEMEGILDKIIMERATKEERAESRIGTTPMDDIAFQGMTI